MLPSGECYKLIARFEGCRLGAYKCPAGVWTIGYGHTKGVKRGMSITNVQALSYLKSDVLIISTVVAALIKVRVTQNQFDALVSFAFNVGTYNFSESTLLKKINSGLALGSIAAEFGRWVYANGEILTGLVKRREAERELFLRG